MPAQHRFTSLTLLGAGAIGLAHCALWRRERRQLAGREQPEQLASALTTTPLVSVLVAAWNEGAGIEAHLRSFQALRYPALELILCAGGADDTYERAVRLADPRVVVLRQLPGEGKQRALARCFAYASGAILFFTDADCRYDDAALSLLLAPLLNAGAQAATGTSRPLDEQLDRPLPRLLWAAELASDLRRSTQSDGILGRNAALTRAAVERIGGLDYSAPTGTDYQLARRLLAAGIAIRFVPESVVPSAYPESLAVLRRKQSRWIRNLITYGPAFDARADVFASLRTIATGATMTALPMLGLAFTPLLSLWLLLLVHACAARVRYGLLAARRCGRPLQACHLATLPALTVAEFAIWALAGLDLIDPRRRDRW